MLFALTIIYFLLQLAWATLDMGMTCAEHPNGNLVERSVLIRSWEFFGSGTAMMVNGRIAYYPRYTELNYYPRDDPTSTKYRNLDFFFVSGAGNHRTEYALAELHFQRPAKIYMFVNAKAAKGHNLQSTLDGWESEGWAVLNSSQMRHFYGLYQKSSYTVTQQAFVYSKKTEESKNSVVIPNFGWVKRNTVNIKAKGSYHIRVAEEDGEPSSYQTTFEGVQIYPNARCPDILHSAWSVPDDNPSDSETARMRFGTWHPQWDPCFWW